MLWKSSLLSVAGLSCGVAAAQGFAPAVTLVPGVNGASDLAVADMDLDGDQDLVFVSNADDVAWLESLGSQGFGPVHTISLAHNGAMAVAVADFDEDGWPDVAVSSWIDEKVSVHFQLPPNGWWEQVLCTTCGMAGVLLAADLDRDQRQDLIYGSVSSNSNATWRNRTGPLFDLVGGPTSDRLYDAVASDFDRDGWLDMLMATGLPYEAIVRRGITPFQWSPELALSSDASQGRATASGDLDGDGTEDAVVAWSSGLMEWFPGDGAGGFGGALTLVSDGVWKEALCVEDLDGDGLDDVVWGGGLLDPVSWRRSLGGGAFAPAAVLADPVADVRRILAGDPDGDGDLDLFLAAWGSGEITWIENLHGPFDCNGNGVADARETGLGQVADCDGDRVPDACQLQDPLLDLNGDGVLDACPGGSPVFCEGGFDPLAPEARLLLGGDPRAASCDLTLVAHGMANGYAGQFLVGGSPGVVEPFAGGLGRLCLGAPLRRLGPVLVVDQQALRLDLGLADIPPGLGIQPGDRLYLQAWFRTYGTAPGQTTTSLSDAVELQLR